jgi:TonB family protein
MRFGLALVAVACIWAGSVAAQVDYKSELRDWLEAHKQYPPGALERGEEGRAILRFRVDRSGRVLDYQVVSSTGYADLDQSIENMMRGAMLPPFPSSMNEPEIDVTVTIRFGVSAKPEPSIPSPGTDQMAQLRHSQLCGVVGGAVNGRLSLLKSEGNSREQAEAVAESDAYPEGFVRRDSEQVANVLHRLVDLLYDGVLPQVIEKRCWNYDYVDTGRHVASGEYVLFDPKR